MKLLREVTGEPEQLKEFGTIICHSLHGVMQAWWVPVPGVWEDADEYQYGPTEIQWWLEPIEITEEEIKGIIVDFWIDQYESRTTTNASEEADVKKLAKAILSKLKGDEE